MEGNKEKDCAGGQAAPPTLNSRFHDSNLRLRLDSSWLGSMLGASTSPTCTS